MARHDLTAIIRDKRGRVLAIGKNSYVKTHPHQAMHAAKVGLPEKQFLHAEIAAIVRCRDLSKAHSIEIIRVTPGGRLALAKPCKVCQSAIEAAGILHVHHS